MALKFVLATLLLAVLWVGDSGPPPDFYCRDPDLGGEIPADMRGKARRFLLIGGGGGGIGNFLIYHPSAYYFAMFTGRDILVIDDSLIGEMCATVHCGYHMYSHMQLAFPNLLNLPVSKVKNAHVWDMHRYLNGEVALDEPILQSIGSKMQSGWYVNYNFTRECAARLTGCAEYDVMCHDRHALQRLVRGPFKAAFTAQEEKRILGVPQNLKHALLSLPHAYAPRLDAAIHIRTQFEHFERLVGPDDSGWALAMKQQNDWLTCSAPECGLQLFKTIEAKIMEELPAIRGKAEAQRNAAVAAGAAAAAGKSVARGRRRLDTFSDAINGSLERSQAELEKEQYNEGGDKIYVYLASDNADVKEAFAKYLIGHANIAVMRVKNNAHIVHAKNVGYLRGAGNNTGVMDLVLDWYALSLANVVFAWRKGTNFISTFAHSAQRLSGNAEASNSSAGIGHGIGSRGLSLFFTGSKEPAWRHFY